MIQLLRNAVVYRDGAWRPSDILVEIGRAHV